MTGGVAVFWRTPKSGALVDVAEAEPDSSAMLKLIISTMLETSFLMLSGSEGGSDFPVSFRLQRYMARANSGKCNCPDLVVSASVLELVSTMAKQIPYPLRAHSPDVRQ